MLSAAGGLAVQALAQPSYCAIPYASILDRQSLYSWEVCGARRTARRPAQGGFWNHFTGGLIPTRSIHGVSDDGNSLLVSDATHVFHPKLGKQLVLCTPSGVWLKNIPFSVDAHTAPRTFGDSVFVIGGLSVREEFFGLLRGSWSTGEWTKVFPVTKPLNHDTVTTNGSAVLISQKGHIVDTATGKRVARGDCPRFSRDGRLLYLRDEQGLPHLFQWPAMTEVPIAFHSRVGTLAEWSPRGDWLLVETIGAMLPRLKIVHLVSGTEFDEGPARMTGTSGHAFRWVNWGPAGPETLNQLEATYLNSQSSRGFASDQLDKPNFGQPKAK
jgi:hypothetical protein